LTGGAGADEVDQQASEYGVESHSGAGIFGSRRCRVRKIWAAETCVTWSAFGEVVTELGGVAVSAVGHDQRRPVPQVMSLSIMSRGKAPRLPMRHLVVDTGFGRRSLPSAVAFGEARSQDSGRNSHQSTGTKRCR